MSSTQHTARDAIVDALDTLDKTQEKLLAFPLHTLTTAELLAVLDRLEAMDRRLAALQQRVVGILAAADPLARRSGPLAGVLSRRLRISDTEARHRIADAQRAAS
jgi:hypothetical protein